MARPTLRSSSLALFAAAAALVAGATFAQPGPGGGQQPPRGPGGAPFVERLMQNDANKDGLLQWDEVPEQIRERLFAGGDTNGDKVLDKAELEALAAARGREGPGGGRPGPGGPAMSMHDAMEQAGRSMRSIKRSTLTAESRDADLEAIQSLQGALVAAKGDIANVQMAPQAKAKYGEDTATFRRDFRRSMIEASILALKLDAAINDGDAAGAAKAREELVAHQQKAHDAFQPEEDEKR